MNNDPISRTPGLRRRQVIQAGASALPIIAWGPARGQQKFVFQDAALLKDHFIGWWQVIHALQEMVILLKNSVLIIHYLLKIIQKEFLSKKKELSIGSQQGLKQVIAL